MKFSKLLAMILGLAGLFNAGIVEGGGGDGGSADGGALDANQAGDLFASLLGAEPLKGEQNETPESAAERLAAEELAGKSALAEGEEPPVAGAGDQAGAEKIPVEIDGKIVELTRAEIADAYKNGLRQADYTRKTMEVADARKSAEAEVIAARQERQNYAQQLNTLAIRLHGDLQEQSKTNWQELLQTDPVAYLEQQRIFQERQAKLGQAQQELAQLNQLHQAEQAESAKQYITAQQQELLAKLPEWKDPVKAKAEAAAVREYLIKAGFDKTEIEKIGDHRTVMLHRKAMLYDGLMERAGAATKRIATVPQKVERPGNGDSRPDGRSQAMQRLSKSGSINDAAAVFSQMFE